MLHLDSFGSKHRAFIPYKFFFLCFIVILHFFSDVSMVVYIVPTNIYFHVIALFVLLFKFVCPFFFFHLLFLCSYKFHRVFYNINLDCKRVRCCSCFVMQLPNKSLIAICFFHSQIYQFLECSQVYFDQNMKQYFLISQ